MKKRILSTIMASALMLNIGVNAATVIVEKNQLTDVFTVSGNVEEAMYSGKVSFAFVSDNNDIAHMANINTNEKGEFTYSFLIADDVPSGYYSATVSAYNRSEAITVPFDEFYVSSTRKGEILNDINNEMTSVGDLTTYLTDNVMKEIGINWPLSLNLSDASKDKARNDIYSGRVYAEVMDLKKVFFENVAIYALSEATNANVVDVWKEYKAYYDTTTALMNSFYQNYNASEKDAAIKRMAGSSITCRSDMIKAFDEAVFLQEVALCRSYSDINSLFENNGSVVPFSLKKFNSLGAVKRGNALYGKSYNNMTELETAINGIDSAGNNGGITVEGTTGGHSGGSGGSGGGGSWGLQNQGKGEIISTQSSAPQSSLFNDMDKGFWAYNAVETLVNKGIISGYPDKTFKPENNITREEFVTVLVKYLGTDLNAECDFADIAKDRWSYSYIAAAYELGIINGDAEKMFKPEARITRQDMAVIVARALNLSGAEAEAFDDENTASDYAIDGIKALRAKDILNGFEDNTFRPFDNATRAEAATIIYKISKGV